MATASLTRALDSAATAAVPLGCRVGVDLTLVSEVAASIATFGARYLDRVYTVAELGDCGSDVRRLAARFAAKEAVTKVLAPRDAPGWWRDIETVRAASGAPHVKLRGATARAAAEAGLSGWSVSLTHEGDYAAAVVTATCLDVTFPQETEA